MENKFLIDRAKKSLEGRWKQGIIISLIYYVISGLFIAILSMIGSKESGGGIVNLLIEAPLAFGVTIFALKVARQEPYDFDYFWTGFRNYGKIVLTNFLMTLFVLLWSCLLIIPGIIALLSYSMTFFILIDEPNKTPMEAIKASKRMMEGKKVQFLCLSLRFLGWALLASLCFGIGWLWLLPYINVSYSHFYDELKKEENRESLLD